MTLEQHNVAALLGSSEAGERKQGLVLAARSNLFALVPRITGMAGNDPDPETRYLARKALEHLNQQAQSEPETAPDKFSAVDIEKLFHSDDPHARFAGLKKVLTEKTPTGRFLLLDALSRETMVQLQASLIIGVGHFRNEADAQILAKYLKSEDARVRANTVEALAMIGSEESLRQIIAVMGDQDNRVKANVLKALQEIGGQSLFNLLKKMAVDDRPWARASAVFAFSRIKSPQSLVVLAGIAQADPDKNIRSRALHAIRIEKEAGNPAAAVILAKLAELSPDTEKTAGDLLAEPAAESDLSGYLLSPESASRYLALTQINTGNLPTFKHAFIKAFETEEDFFLLGLMLNLVRDLKIVECFSRSRLLLMHQDDRVRANAVEALAMIDLAKAAEVLLPLLEDHNSRVVANALLALEKARKVDVVAELKRMLARGRESFKHSVIYVISQIREALAIPLLEKLLRDPNPRLRDKAFAVLQTYAVARVSGASAFLRDVEKQIQLERNRDSFFDNGLDVAFAGLINMIRSGSGSVAEVPDKIQIERTPQNERAALLTLASRCLELKIVDARTLEVLSQIESELGTVDELLQKAAAGDHASLSLPESAKMVSEEQLLKIERESLVARKEAVLAAYAFDFFNARGSLDSRTFSLLRTELGRVEGSLCSLVPQKLFSMLPTKEAAVSEIFDITMRLYQKHVYTFSVKTLLQFGKWLAGFAVLGGICLAFMAASPPVAGFFMILSIPYYSYKSLQMMVEWKILITLMVDDYIHGREFDAEKVREKSASLFNTVFANSLKKHLMLGLWLIIAGFCTASIVGAAAMLGRQGIIWSLGVMCALIVGLLVMGGAYFRYLLVEPASVISPKLDAFDVADRYYNRDRLKLGSLFIFATFIMTIITGTSTEIMTFFMPVLPALIGLIMIQALSLVSEVCLAPIIYANLVIYYLMSQKVDQT